MTDRRDIGRPYMAPGLTRLGHVAALTMGGSPTGGIDGGNKCIPAAAQTAPAPCT